MLMLDHMRFRRYLDAHVDNELAGDLASRVAAHVGECPMCGREAQVTVHVKQSLARRRPGTQRAADRIREWARREIK